MRAPVFSGFECNLIVLHAGDVLDDAFAVSDAESKVSPECGHLPFAPSGPRFPTSASDEHRRIPELDAWVKHSPPKRLRNASALAVSGKQNRI